MNLPYLLQYVSRALHTAVRQFSREGQLIECACLRMDLAGLLQSPDSVYRKYDSSAAAHILLAAEAGLPAFFMVEHHPAAGASFHSADHQTAGASFHSADRQTSGIGSQDAGPAANSSTPGTAPSSNPAAPFTLTYAAVPAPDGFFLIGPVLVRDCGGSRHTLPEYHLSPELLSLLPVVTVRELTEQALLLCCLFREEAVSFEDVISYNFLREGLGDEIQQELTSAIFHRQEYDARHNPYDQEVREIASIQKGDLAQLKKSWTEDYPGTIGTLAKTPLRHSQNHGIVLVTLGSRAAMEAGVLPELAYSLSDIYIQKIEEAPSPEAAVQLGRQAEYQYASLVRGLQKKGPAAESGDPRIEQCKSYIFSHLHERIRISQLAEELYLNSQYLCELFKKETGMTIGDYILTEKVHLIQNMLTYSRYSYSEIAAYFGFSSQSHLGRQFKKATGMTLHQYRRKYGVKDSR